MLFTVLASGSVVNKDSGLFSGSGEKRQINNQEVVTFFAVIAQKFRWIIPLKVIKVV